MNGKVCQVSHRYLQRYGGYQRKTEGGRIQPPPGGCGLSNTGSINNIILKANVTTILGQNATMDNFRTLAAKFLGHRTYLDRYFSETGTTNQNKHSIRCVSAKWLRFFFLPRSVQKLSRGKPHYCYLRSLPVVGTRQWWALR